MASSWSLLCLILLGPMGCQSVQSGLQQVCSYYAEWCRVICKMVGWGIFWDGWKPLTISTQYFTLAYKHCSVPSWLSLENLVLSSTNRFFWVDWLKLTKTDQYCSVSLDFHSILLSALRSSCRTAKRLQLDWTKTTKDWTISLSLSVFRIKDWKKTGLRPDSSVAPDFSFKTT